MPTRRLILAALPALFSPVLMSLSACSTVPAVEDATRDTTRAASRDTARDATFDAAVHAALGSDFNGVVLLRHGKSGNIRRGAYGMADFGAARPMHGGARFQIASISKWITSITLLRLAEQGKLKLDDPVRTYVPELPAASAANVTLRHLLSNTSGIPDGVMAAFKQDKAIGALTLSPLEAALRFGSGPSRFAPGTTFDYAVTNWVILAAAVERATNARFIDVVAQQVFAPAGMRDSGFAPADFGTVPDAALAYTASLPRILKMPPTGAFAAASGTMYSTADDLARLGMAVLEGNLLNAKSRQELSTILVPAENYALGGRVRAIELGGAVRTVAYESGATGAYKSLLMHVHGEGNSVVILNNTDIAQTALAKAGETLLGSLY